MKMTLEEEFAIWWNSVPKKGKRLDWKETAFMAFKAGKSSAIRESKNAAGGDKK